MLKKYICIGEASAMLGVSVQTLRRWHSQKKFVPEHKTSGGHRRYSYEQIIKKLHPSRKNRTKRINIGYARVSSHDQKEDLKTQIVRLEQFGQKYDNFKVIDDLGSGLNYKKRGIVKLIHMICTAQIDTLVMVHKDRLLRFGSEIIFNLCEIFGTKVVILESIAEEDFEKQLCNDVIELMTVFSARLYGKRSGKNKKKIAEAA